MNPAMKKRYDLLGPLVAEACRRRNFEAYYCSEKEDISNLQKGTQRLGLMGT